jgi:hypothetical protein
VKRWRKAFLFLTGSEDSPDCIPEPSGCEKRYKGQMLLGENEDEISAIQYSIKEDQAGPVHNG